MIRFRLARQDREGLNDNPSFTLSTEQALWNNIAYQMFYGTDTTQVWHLKLRTPAGKLVDHNYQFHTCRAQWVRRKVNQPFQLIDFKIIDGIAYVQLNSFGDGKLVDTFKKIVPQLQSCKGVILDLRGNGGGDSGIGAAILKYFTDEKKLVGSTWKARDNISAYKAWGTWDQRHDTTRFEHLDNWHQKMVLASRGDYWLQGDTMTFVNDVTGKKISSPLIVLTGNSTASAAEDFLIMLSGLKGRATTIGQRTYGSTGQPLPLTLPGLNARICAKRDTYPDGRDFVGIGVIPDIELPRNVGNVLNGTDSELAFAIKEMRKKIR